MKSILIAETSAITKSILEIAFTDLEGFEGKVIFADNSDEALNLIKIHKPDLLLVSDSQEFQNLEEFYTSVRNTEFAEKIPFIALYTPGHPVYISDDPSFISIQKPFSVIKLLGVIKGLTNGKINEDIMQKDNNLKEKPNDEEIRLNQQEEDIENEKKSNPKLFLNFEGSLTSVSMVQENKAESNEEPENSTSSINALFLDAIDDEEI